MRRRSSDQPMMGLLYGCALNAMDDTSSARKPSGSSSVRVRRSSITTWRSESISLASSRRLCIGGEGGDGHDDEHEERGETSHGTIIALASLRLDRCIIPR